jgi:hypothetical protein
MPKRRVAWPSQLACAGVASPPEKTLVNSGRLGNPFDMNAACYASLVRIRHYISRLKLQ